MTNGLTRLAVDIGGTFTDVVLEKDSRQTSCKVLTTNHAPADGFMLGVSRVLEATGTKPNDIDLIIHGTTLATNALIERKGVRTALIVTEGHRDSLEIAYENRFDQYDINADRLPPLVPRALRWPVQERVNWRGDVLTPLDEATLEPHLASIEEAGVESIAIGLLHAYANPAHEERIAELIANAYPQISLSLSSQVCPEIREYERQTTTCANAYIRPIIASYLANIERELKRGGFQCPCLLMTSAGSLVTIATAIRYPVRLMESGPAGGAILASHIAAQLGEDRVISFDMGGTTAKICLIDDSKPMLSRMLEVDRAHRFMRGSGTPVKIPVVEMVEIGAGGGSIAHVDALGRINIGPQSAGADPGPACYDRGGIEPTITDGNLVLGRLDGANFANGTIRLNEAAAGEALSKHIGNKLDLDVPAAAQNIIETVDENMANAAKVHAAERGKDVARRTMIAFGGAAPLHAARLAEKLGISRIIVPADAGVGSAVGFLLAPIAYEVVRSQYMPLSAFAPDQLNAVFKSMREEAFGVVRQGAPKGELTEQRFAYARYMGQGHEIKTELPVSDFNEVDVENIQNAFETEYKRQFGRVVPGLDIEILSWSLVVSAPAGSASDRKPNIKISRENELTSSAARGMRILGQEQPQETALFKRNRIGAGDYVLGPAAIEEDHTTTIVPAGFSAAINGGGDLIVECHEIKSREDAKGQNALGISGKIHLQVIWDRLISVVEEQAQALIRTAFSTTVREAGDLSAGIFDLKGQMLAQAITGTPGHVNAMAAAVGFFLEKYPVETMAEGDVYVTNDPWFGTGHLFDFTMVTPVFKDDAPVALFASTVHVVDIGGRGFGPDCGQVFEEGLCIPICPLFKRGVANESVFDIVRANVREPVQVIGDLYSLTACNDVGSRRLIEMMVEFGLHDLNEISQHIIETSRRAMLEEICSLPFGVFENEMTVDGYESPVVIKARLTIGRDGIDVDFTGTSPASPFGINVPYTYTMAYASFGIRGIVGNRIPNNAGSLAPIRIHAPAGSIVNAPRPCAVAVRHVIGQMLPDVVLGCLDKAVPGCAPAEGSSSLWNPMLTGGHGLVDGHMYGDATPFSVTIFHSGGTGARPNKDGLSATAYPSGVRNTPVEITESVSPLIFHRKELRVGSGGKGRHRGGDGQVIEVGHAEDAPFALFAIFDRIDHPARGRAGGGDGQPGKVYLASGAKLKGKGKQIIPAGDKIVLELPGGGGLGKNG